MSKSFKIGILSFAIVALAACSGRAQNDAAPFSAYLAALAATSHGETTAEDVEHVLGYYAEDVVYEHPAVGIRLEGIDAQRQGLTAFVASYAGGAADSTIEVIDYIEGPSVVMLRLKVQFLMRRDETSEKISRDQWRLIETKDGKITRIIDYW